MVTLAVLRDDALLAFEGESLWPFGRLRVLNVFFGNSCFLVFLLLWIYSVFCCFVYCVVVHICMSTCKLMIFCLFPGILSESHPDLIWIEMCWCKDVSLHVILRLFFFPRGSVAFVEGLFFLLCCVGLLFVFVGGVVGVVFATMS